MKSFLRTIYIWILSLSLTGMPVVALSQDVADLARFGEDSVTEVSAEYVGDMPCHHNAILVNTKVAQTVLPLVKEQPTEINASIDDACCCATDCQCQYDMACQADGQLNIFAILQSIRFISFPLNSQLILEPAVLYHYRDADLDIIPPIV